MEKSFLSFAATYPAWQPGTPGQQLLRQLAAAGAGAPVAVAGGPAAAARQQSLAWSLLPAHQRQQQHRQHQVFGNRGGAATSVGAVEDGIFGSADLGLPADERSVVLAAATGAAAAAGEDAAAGRVSGSQLLLQSLYSQRRQQQQQQQQQPVAVSLPVSSLAASGLGSPAALRAQAQQEQRNGFASVQQQGAMPIPRATAAPGAQAAAAASPGHPAIASASPQQRFLLQQAGAGAASPRQTWLGRWAASGVHAGLAMLLS
jgi:hypothetical protein